MPPRGTGLWLAAGLASLVLHVALFIASVARPQGEAATPSGAAVESASSLGGIIGAPIEVQANKATETPVAVRPVEATTRATERVLQSPLEPAELRPSAEVVRPTNLAAEQVETQMVAATQVEPTTLRPQTATDRATEPAAAIALFAPPATTPSTPIPSSHAAIEPPDAAAELTPPRADRRPVRRATGDRAPDRSSTRRARTVNRPTASREAKPNPAGRVAVARQAQRPERQRAVRPQRQGAAVSGSTGRRSGAGSRQTSASTTAINSYAAKVRARILSRSPRSVGARGTTVISFGLTSSGQLRFASISRSSGDARLDAGALAAVRRGGFPQPPAGASAGQLSFVIPFHFR
ncbi:MAG: TonB family protein [Rhizobiales bacterium]|nr:TonB family protein [Hyphomicrobiales bacterium]